MSGKGVEQFEAPADRLFHVRSKIGQAKKRGLNPSENPLLWCMMAIGESNRAGLRSAIREKGMFKNARSFFCLGATGWQETPMATPRCFLR